MTTREFKFRKSISGCIMLVVFALVYAGCSKDDGEEPLIPTLSVEPIALSFTATAAESHEVVVTTNQSSWDAVSFQTWCTITKSNGKFTVKATANTSTSSPTPAVITVTAGTAKPVTINVTQSGVGAELSVTPNTPVSFSSTGGESEAKTITVTTNQSSWNVTSNQTWCTVSKSGNSFTFTASANTGAEPRNAIITVSAGNAANVTIEVTQAGVGAQLSVNIDTSSPFTFTGAGGTSEAKTVTTNQSSWNVVSDQSWCTVAKSGNTFTITASANTGTAQRSAIVTVSAGSAANITINIIQAGAASADDYNLKKAAYCLAHIMKVTEDKKKGINIYNISGVTNVVYNSNQTIDYMDFIYYDAVVPFSYNSPLVISGVKGGASAATSAKFAIGNGSYDYANDPSKIVAYFGNFSAPLFFSVTELGGKSTLEKLRSVANNENITGDAFNFSFTDNTYKILIFGKNKAGVLIGKYIGYSDYNTIQSQLYFNYSNIDPDDTNYGKTLRMAIP